MFSSQMTESVSHEEASTGAEEEEETLFTTQSTAMPSVIKTSNIMSYRKTNDVFDTKNAMFYV